MIIRREKKGFFVLNVNPADLEKPKDKEERRVISEIAKLAEETLAVVFERDLALGWKERILEAGWVHTSDGMSLDSVLEIEKAMTERGEICFSARNGHSSLAFVRMLCIPKKNA